MIKYVVIVKLQSKKNMKVQKIDKSEKEKDIKFPILMESISNESIVLFSSPNTGILLYTNSASLLSIGYQADDWVSCLDSTCWKPFTGEIILENEDNV